MFPIVLLLNRVTSVPLDVGVNEAVLSMPLAMMLETQYEGLSQSPEAADNHVPDCALMLAPEIRNVSVAMLRKINRHMRLDDVFLIVFMA
jgi:hypothetical protein